jgi:tripartite-type tricarboxylate transporter receptor subunit TctC
MLPDVPTVGETLAGFASETWFGIGAPARTPRDILLKLNAAARQALATPDTKSRFADLGMTTGTSSPEELDAYIKAEITKWSKVIKDANIQSQD